VEALLANPTGSLTNSLASTIPTQDVGPTAILAAVDRRPTGPGPTIVLPVVARATLPLPTSGPTLVLPAVDIRPPAPQPTSPGAPGPTLVLPFEVISLVFVAAMVGAIALAAQPRRKA
jgi:hypothetical protein